MHVKTFFFSFLRPPSPTKAAKTWRMVARDVVHLEISGSPAESTQIRSAEGCRAQMAASLALFFFYIAPSRSTFSDRAVYDAGSWVPHVILYEPKFFLFLDFFDPLISGYFLFLLIPCRLGNVETAAAKWDPHVILYVQSTFFSWSFFWHLKFGHLPFSFDPLPPLKR